MKDIYELWQKYGNQVVIFFVAAYFYSVTERQQTQIESIQTKLYDCYEDKATLQRLPLSKLPLGKFPNICPDRKFAVLPNEIKIKKYV
jgi:hypothetical protein